MGMSASQARFLGLTARKNNVEFQGQQINQQRTTLSNTSSAYYSELCNLVVPTPPSVDDYTKVTYTFDDGALTNTINSMIAKGNDEYSISYIQQWQDDYSIVAASSSIISASVDEEETDRYKIGSTALRKVGDFSEVDTYYKNDNYLSTLTETQLKELKEQEEYYVTMLNDTVYNDASSNATWYVRYVQNSTTGIYSPYFYSANEIENPNNYKDGNSVKNINCYSLGSTTKTKEVLNQQGTVEKDSTGRYISIMLYNTDADGYKQTSTGEKLNDANQVVIVDEAGNAVVQYDEEGKPKIGVPIYTVYNLTTNTSTDEDAYNDAMNKYNYEQYKYEQRIQDINSKIEVVQQQDKALELQLKQLDTEENAINTEMDAVKKVISKNVDSSFKTFSA